MLDEEMPEGAAVSEDEVMVDDEAAKLNIDLTGVWDQAPKKQKNKRKKKKHTKHTSSDDETETTPVKKVFLIFFENF